MDKRCGYDPASLANMEYLFLFGKKTYNLCYTVVVKLILNCAEELGKVNRIYFPTRI